MNFNRVISTIDTHTAGGPTRIVTNGLPALPGVTAAEMMKDFQANCDHLRQFLLNEPRGHSNMYGAVIAPSKDPHADLSVFFMTTHGYLSTCVHSSMGVAAALLETGSHKLRSDGNIYMDTPGGLIPLTPVYKDGRLVEISLMTLPGFVYEASVNLDFHGQTIYAAVVFCGVFFLLIDINQIGKPANQDNLHYFVAMGKDLLQNANSHIFVQHPTIPSIQNIALALFYESRAGGGYRDIVINSSGGIDRSPCGAGSGALAIYHKEQGNIKAGEKLTIEGVIGTYFQAEIVRVVKVGNYRGAIPKVSGSAWITGLHQFLLDENDPLKKGFVLSP